MFDKKRKSNRRVILSYGLIIANYVLKQVLENPWMREDLPSWLNCHFLAGSTLNVELTWFWMRLSGRVRGLLMMMMMMASSSAGEDIMSVCAYLLRLAPSSKVKDGRRADHRLIDPYVFWEFEASLEAFVLQWTELSGHGSLHTGATCDMWWFWVVQGSHSVVRTVATS